MANLDVAVVGVANIDLVTRMSRLPAEGQTAFGTPLQAIPGGKGFNQAIAVARHGGRAALAAQAGDDKWGQQLRSALLTENVDTSAFAIVPGGETAAVLVQVPDSGDSAVTVTRTSTTLHTLSDIDRARDVLAAAAVAIVQLELDPQVITAAAHAASGVKIGTLAPLYPVPELLYSTLDVIVVNASEARTILGRGGESLDGLGMAKSLTTKGVRTAIVTLGADGAAFANDVSADLVPAHRVTVRNTTGAGDTFLGVMALCLARGVDLPIAVAAAVEAATRGIQ